MPKLDVSIDKELYKLWNDYLEGECINKSALIRKLIIEYLEKKGVKVNAKKRGN